MEGVSMRIENRPEPFEIQVKRFYLPARVTDTCPNCGKEQTRDLDGDYLSYPKANAPEPVNFYCDCEHEWQVWVTLRVTLEPARPPDPGAGR
jgi:hypothetical protein